LIIKPVNPGEPDIKDIDAFLERHTRRILNRVIIPGTCRIEDAWSRYECIDVWFGGQFRIRRRSLAGGA
jgi:hypothetical protein